jgi:hypothetical protein
MRKSQHLAYRGLAALVLAGCAITAGAQQVSSNGDGSPSVAIQAAAPSLPDSPGVVRHDSPPVKAEMARLSEGGEAAAAQATAPSTQQNTSAPQRPVGTAAAEAPNVSAIAASQPAGAAIAPAKQHRVRTIVLRTGAIVGTVVAVGAVVALTSATSSKPPGAH